jgi:uncharacterized protein (DUF1330 family)
MGTYVIAQLKFTDIERYRSYQKAFPAVFSQFDGAAIIADEAPTVLEGRRECDKVVVLYFSSAAEAARFQSSPDYLKISDDRKAGASAQVVVAEGADISVVA